MKKNLPFELIKLTNNEIFIICKRYESIDEFYKDAERVLKKQKFSGIVYFDKLSYTHNSDRFIKVSFKSNEFIWKQSKVIKGNDELKSITSNYFHNNPQLLSSTLLLETEKQKIINGETI